METALAMEGTERKARVAAPPEVETSRTPERGTTAEVAALPPEDDEKCAVANMTAQTAMTGTHVEAQASELAKLVVAEERASAQGSY